MSQSYMIRGHCEERSRFLRFARNRLRNPEKMVEIAMLPLVARNDNFLMRLLRPYGARNDNGKRKNIRQKKVKK